MAIHHICERCGFDLDGLESRPCPECACPVHLVTSRPDFVRRMSASRMVVWLLGAWIAEVVFTVALFSLAVESDPLFWLTVSLIQTLAVIAVVVGPSIVIGSRSLPRFRWCVLFMVGAWTIGASYYALELAVLFRTSVPLPAPSIGRLVHDMYLGRDLIALPFVFFGPSAIAILGWLMGVFASSSMRHDVVREVRIAQKLESRG